MRQWLKDSSLEITGQNSCPSSIVLGRLPNLYFLVSTFAKLGQCFCWPNRVIVRIKCDKHEKQRICGKYNRHPLSLSNFSPWGFSYAFEIFTPYACYSGYRHIG